MSDAATTDETDADAEVLAFERPTTVRVERGTDPFAELSDHERALLLVRVLCELVAYDAGLAAHARAS